MFDPEFLDLDITGKMVVHGNLFVLEQLSYPGIVFLIAPTDRASAFGSLALGFLFWL